MERSNNCLKWMSFSGLAEDYPTWSTRFSAFAQTKGFFETLTDTVTCRPAPLREDANDEQTREHEAQTQARATAVQEDESRKNQIWCYLAMTLDASSLMLIQQDCVNSKGLGDGQSCWRSLATSPATLQKRRDNHSYQSDEAVGQTTTSRGQSHPPVLHQSARIGHPVASCW